MILLQILNRALVTLILIPVLAACSAGASVDSTTASPDPTSPGSQSPSPSISSTNSNSMFTGCDPSVLVINWGQAEGAAGTDYRKITFKNISSNSCEVTNFPTVKLLDSVNGSSLGEVSIREGISSQGLPITLPAGKTLDLSIGTSNPDNYNEQDCRVKSAKAILFDPHDLTGFTYQLNFPESNYTWKFCTTKGNTPFFASFELEK